MLTRWKVTRAAFGAVSKLLELQLRGDGDEGNDDGAAPEDDAPFYQQLGVAVRPVVARSLRALGVEDGDEVVVLKLWHKESDRTPTDLDAGETRVYAAGNLATVLRLLASQAVLDAATVLLGAGASKGVARATDPVSVTIPTGTTFTGTVGGIAAILTTTVPVTCTGTITSGSTTVRAKD
jgi:hypothetical protein